ncbi:hypothetical protein [Bacillus phage SRT01hs]|uniref:Uncharacterized protein n=1 Tax=Bacillus phage SRT01hs TaxID=2847044 RepID=A0A6B9SW35_9CAUD|nr:hypothetical protein H3022_gp28 [Bacillus phage SRT01hs]QHJ75880.1 hypothetical protein [Bacillus phage SRT01hs]
MKYVLKSSDGGYFEKKQVINNETYIITNKEQIMAREFSLKDIRDGVVNDLVYKASTRYGLHFNLIQVDEKVDIPDSYNEIFDIFKRQLSKGIEKYGQDVDKSNLSAIEWVDHSLGEVADMMVYLVKLKGELKKLVEVTKKEV